MFIRLIFTQLKTAVRTKRYVFWTLFFPIGLGTLFSFAFNSIYEGNKSSTIPVAVIVEDNAMNEYKVMQAFSGIEESGMKEDLEEYYTEKATAEAMGTEFDKESPVDEDTLEMLEGIDGYEDMQDVAYDSLPQKYINDDVKNLTPQDLPFMDLLDQLEYENGKKMIEVKYKGFPDDSVNNLDLEKAEQFLKDGEIKGIITINALSDIKLEISENGISESILSNIISTYRQKTDLIISVMNDDVANADMEGLLAQTTENKEYTNTNNLTGGNKDVFVQYFYNLIAMICIMGSMASLGVVVDSQANQSYQGMRIDASPVNKMLYELAFQAGVVLVQEIVAMFALTFYTKVLGINFGADTGMVYLTTAVCTLLGCALGFFVGHVGSFSQNIKEVILMTFVLGGGFLSGLMLGDMKGMIEEKCPIINRINPSAVISEAFTSLNLFGVGDRYYRSMITVVAMTLVLTILGMLLSGRKQYASL